MPYAIACLACTLEDLSPIMYKQIYDALTVLQTVGDCCNPPPFGFCYVTILNLDLSSIDGPSRSLQDNVDCVDDVIYL